MTENSVNILLLKLNINIYIKKKIKTVNKTNDLIKDDMITT